MYGAYGFAHPSSPGAALAPVGTQVSPLALAAAATTIVVALAAYDTWAYHRMDQVAHAGQQPAD